MVLLSRNPLRKRTSKSIDSDDVNQKVITVPPRPNIQDIQAQLRDIPIPPQRKYKTRKIERPRQEQKIPETIQSEHIYRSYFQIVKSIIKKILYITLAMSFLYGLYHLVFFHKKIEDSENMRKSQKNFKRYLADRENFKMNQLANIKRVRLLKGETINNKELQSWIVRQIYSREDRNELAYTEKRTKAMKEFIWGVLKMRRTQILKIPILRLIYLGLEYKYFKQDPFYDYYMYNRMPLWRKILKNIKNYFHKIKYPGKYRLLYQESKLEKDVKAQTIHISTILNP